MDSINKNQPEENVKDLTSVEATKKIKDLVEKAETCFFCTSVSIGNSEASRPMNVLDISDDGHLWFLSASDSYKNQEILMDPKVTLYFQGSKHSHFLKLNGTAKISKDKSRIEDLWNPILKTWFTEGKDDSRITVIEVVPLNGYYWDNKNGNAIAGIKMVIGVAIGKTLDDSIEGRIN